MTATWGTRSACRLQPVFQKMAPPPVFRELVDEAVEAERAAHLVDVHERRLRADARFSPGQSMQGAEPSDTSWKCRGRIIKLDEA